MKTLETIDPTALETATGGRRFAAVRPGLGLGYGLYGAGSPYLQFASLTSQLQAAQAAAAQRDQNNALVAAVIASRMA